MNQPEENRRKTSGSEPAPRPAVPRRDTDAGQGTPGARQVVEVHGSDVQAGGETTETPRAGTTEPPD